MQARAWFVYDGTMYLDRYDLSRGDVLEVDKDGINVWSSSAARSHGIGLKERDCITQDTGSSEAASPEATRQAHEKHS